MKKLKKVFLLLFTVSICMLVNAQNNYQDVVYLKNGSIIRGVIIEQIPNVSVKIQTADNNIFVFKMEEIQKMTKESVPTAEKPKSAGSKEIQTDNGLHYYQGSTKISKGAVDILIKGSNNEMAYQEWKKGRRSIDGSKTAVGFGVPCTITGLAAAIAFLATEDDIPKTIAICTLPLGSALLIGGLTALSNGKQRVIKAIDNYNSSLKSSSMLSNVKLNFGVSQNMTAFSINYTF